MKKIKTTFIFLFLITACALVRRPESPTIAASKHQDTIRKLSTQIITYKPKIYDYKRLDSLYQPLFKSNYYNYYSKRFDTLQRQQNATNTNLAIKMDSLAMNQKTSSKLESLLLQTLLQSKAENHIQKDTITKLKKAVKVTNETRVKAEAHDTLDMIWVWIGAVLLSIRLLLTAWAWFDLHTIKVNIQKKHNYV